MEPFDAYIAPARARSGFWRVLLGALVLVGVYLAGALVVLLGWLGVNYLVLGDLGGALERMDQLMLARTRLTMMKRSLR